MTINNAYYNSHRTFLLNSRLYCKSCLFFNSLISRQDRKCYHQCSYFYGNEHTVRYVVDFSVWLSYWILLISDKGQPLTFNPLVNKARTTLSTKTSTLATLLHTIPLYYHKHRETVKNLLNRKIH